MTEVLHEHGISAAKGASGRLVQMQRILNRCADWKMRAIGLQKSESTN